MTHRSDPTDMPPPPLAVPLAQPPVAHLSVPVGPAERIDALDIVRGIALFGVFMVNMLNFAGPYLNYEQLAVSNRLFGSSQLFWMHWLVEFSIWILGEGAFYTQFAFLFGLGLAMQIARANDRNERYGRRLVSRLVVLFAFGLLHYVLLWDGDILANYAVAGLLFLGFARTKPQTRLRFGIGLLGFCACVFAALMMLEAIFGEPPSATPTLLNDKIVQHQSLGFVDRITDTVSFGAIAAQILVPTLWFVGLFLVGSWVVTSGKVDDWRNQRDLLVKVLKVSVPVAVVARGGIVAIMFLGPGSSLQSIRWLLSMIVGGPALGVTYLSLTLLALQNDGPVSRILANFAPVGRMALTNYLLQSVLGVVLFRSYGLGFYGKLGAATTFTITVAVFAAQVALSRVWLARFQFGPMEWLWRKLTYRRLV